jgi:predicted PurR-regulated permease PerM
MLYAALVYAGVHVAEAYLVSPLVMRRAVELRPALLLFWQLFMAAIFGLPGVIVATPLLACAKIAAGYLYVEQRLGKRDPEDLRPEGNRDAADKDGAFSSPPRADHC